MKNSNYPRLSGGTFFILVLQALRQRMKAREHFRGESDGLKDPNVLVGLIKVINPAYITPAGNALKTKTNDFKSCKVSTGEYLPFGNTAEVEAFDNRVRNNYGSPLKAMAGFVDQFLETDTENHKDVRLVKALIELIKKDESIDWDEEFFISESGKKIKKTALCDLTNICLPAFLLGIWHYVVVKRKDNKVGQATYNVWCPPAGGGPRDYSGNMGKAITHDIKVYTISVSEDEPEVTMDEEDPVHEEQTAQTPPPSAVQVYNNNPLFIQQNGDGNVVMPNYGTINITFGKK